MEKIVLDSKTGAVCCSYTHIENSKSIVIISHGFLSNKSSRTGVALAQELHKAGISTIAFDFYGHGESEGDIEQLTLSKAVENVLAVYDFITSKGYKQVGLAGSSFSGAVSVIAATKRTFDVLSLKCPVFDYQKLWFDRLGENGLIQWKKEGFVTLFEKRVSYETYEDAARYAMPFVARCVSAPTLVIHGDKDITVSLIQAENLIASLASTDKRLMIIHGAVHFFVSPLHFKQMVKLSAEWLILHLA
jgi:hypothetical protein